MVEGSTLNRGVGERRRLRFTRAICRPLPPILALRTGDLLDPPAERRDAALRFTRRGVTGSSVSGCLDDAIAYRFAVHGYFNWRNLAIARALCAPGDAIVEVGANIGTETLGYSDIVGFASAVYAFEPSPVNVALLRENVERAENPNVVVHPYAVSDRAGVVRFAAAEGSNTGIGYVLGTGAHDATLDDIEIETVRLDDLAENFSGVKLLSIDAEGHETAIVRGAAGLLERDRPTIVLEAEEALLRRSGSSCAQLAALLREHRYVPFAIRRLGLDSGSGEAPRDTDWLVVPMENLALARRVHRELRRCGLTPCAFGLNPLSV